MDIFTVRKDKDGRVEIRYMEVRDQENKELEIDIQRDWYRGWLEKQPVGWKELLQQTPTEGVLYFISDDVFQLIGEFAGITESVQYDLLTPPVVVPDHLRMDLYRLTSAPFLPEVKSQA